MGSEIENENCQHDVVGVSTEAPWLSTVCRSANPNPNVARTGGKKGADADGCRRRDSAASIRTPAPRGGMRRVEKWI